MKIGNLAHGQHFMYSGKQYIVLNDVNGECPRFKIQERCFDVAGRFQKKRDRIYVFCCETGQLGSFHKVTGVSPLQETSMPDSPDKDFPMPETARRDALLEVVAKHKHYMERCELVLAEKEVRNTAREEYEAACAVAEEVCAKTGFSGMMVRGTTVVYVRATGISVDDGEFLE